MSKRGKRFEPSSGWTSRTGGGAEKSQPLKAFLKDVSEGSQRMADGVADARAAEMLERERRKQ